MGMRKAEGKCLGKRDSNDIQTLDKRLEESKIFWIRAGLEKSNMSLTLDVFNFNYPGEDTEFMVDTRIHTGLRRVAVHWLAKSQT